MVALEADSSASPPLEGVTSPEEHVGRKGVGVGHGSGSLATRFGGERAPARSAVSRGAGQTTQTNPLDLVAAEQLRIATGKDGKANASARTAAARAYAELHAEAEERLEREEAAGRVDWAGIGVDKGKAIKALLRRDDGFARYVVRLVEDLEEMEDAHVTQGDEPAHAPAEQAGQAAPASPPAAGLRRTEAPGVPRA